MPARKLRPLGIGEIAFVLPALTRCERHPTYIVLPFFGFRPCCLVEALDRIRRDEACDARAVADAALETGANVKLPRFWRKKPPPATPEEK